MEVVAGVGAASRLAVVLERRGYKKALLVAGGTTERLEIFAQIRDGLRDIGIAHARAGRANPLPLIADVEAAAEVLRRERCDVVIAVGGGSVLDLAKVAAIVAAEGSPAERHAVKFNPPDDVVIPDLRAPKVPVVAVPTTFSGSEGNGSGHIRGGAERYARSFRHDPVMPSIVVLDPAAGEGQRPAAALASALNGLAHCTDGLCVRGRTPFSDALSTQGARMFFASLPGLVRDPADPVARLDAQWASLFGGMVIRHAYVGFHHALAHAVGNICKVRHADANAVLLPYTIGWHLEHAPAQDRERLRAALPDDWRERLREASRDGGLPGSLREAGASLETLDEAAHDAMNERMVLNEPLPMSAAIMRDVLARAFEAV